MAAEAKIIGGRYELLELIGQGGFATVYRGRDLQNNETVAIKLLKPEVVEFDPGLTERFTREAEALRKLNHPSIVKALAMIEEDDQHYAVMEFVSGGDLRTLLEREGKLPAQRVLEIGLDLTDALARAHRMKIIHRDIKPANVLMAQDGTPRLTDFGIARFTDSAGQTQTGQLMGTLAYLSPEGCIGEALDHRTDIWSLGITFYEMLAGVRPFQSHDGNHAALLLSILSNPPPPLESLVPEAPAAFINLIERMMEKDRDQRIQSVRQVGAQIEAILAGQNEILEDSGLFSTDGAAVEDDPQPKTPTQKILRQFQPNPPHTPTPIATILLDDTPVSAADSTTKSARLNPLVLVGGGLILVALIAAVLLLPNLNRAAEVNPTAEAAQIQPVEAGEFMVLVAPLEMIGSTQDSVTRFIYEDLQRKFEREVLFSPYRVRLLSTPVTSPEQAFEAAEANRAAVIVWGNYDGETARVNIWLGSLAIYDQLPLTREQITRISDGTYLVKNAREESLSTAVLGVMNIVQTANNSMVDIALNLAIFDQLRAAAPAVDGTSAAAHWHRYFGGFLEGGETSLEEINRVIQLDGGNPIAYGARSLSLIRLAVESGDKSLLDEAMRDIRTAGRLFPQTVIIDEMQLGQIELFVNSDAAASIPYFDAALSQQPDDWLAVSMRGVAYYLMGDYEKAKADIDRALSLNPEFPPVYVYALPIALHRAEFAEAQGYFTTLTTRFPDPRFTERLLSASYGLTSETSPLIASIAAVTTASLLQWDEVITQTDRSIQTFALSDLYLIRGLAFCNLEDYDSAQEAFTQALEIEPGYVFPQALRAQLRLQSGDLIGGGQDFASVLASPQAEQVVPYIPAFRSGDINCANLFDVDLSAYLAIPAP